MSDDTRGLGKLKEEGREDEVQEIASKGGQSSPAKFQPGDPRAQMAGKKGGRSQGQENNPGNFANRPKEEVEEAARKGGSR